jgi:MFS family permease
LIPACDAIAGTYRYQSRRVVQAVFIVALGVISAAALAVLYVRGRYAHRGTFIALVGAALLISFIVMRAVSFHHVDVLIGSTFLGMRWNWIFEIGGILLVMYGNRIRAASITDARTVSS